VSLRRWKFKGGLGDALSIGFQKPSRRVRMAIQYKRINLRCENCGHVGVLETDHIVPLHKGGKDEWSNLQALCVSCHRAKTAREASDRAG
jgi:5-methylcytosine-specific restriction protein A